MQNINIKGIITPYTPRGRSKRINAGNTILDNVVFDNANSIEIIINGRKCSIQKVTYKPNYGDKKEIKYFYLYPLDEPLPPKKPHKAVTDAEKDAMRFCHSNDWKELFNSYDSTYRNEYRHHLIEELSKIKLTNNCNQCGLRFKCLTLENKEQP
jgi:hypothetical protein